MQLLGVNLKELKESFKECKFQIQTVIIIALQLMNRLQSIHSLGYIHWDLKPANVLLFGRATVDMQYVKLSDFGSIGTMEGSLMNSAFITNSRGYMAPEMMAKIVARGKVRMHH